VHIEPTKQAPTRAQIEGLQHNLSSLPQVELPTEHYFSNGMYCRKMIIPSGIVIVGKAHKEPHFFILASGQMKVWTDQGELILNSGDVIPSPSGVKRVLMTITDCIGMNVHRTDKTDLDEIEKELIEEDETAMFDARNQLKKPIIQHEGKLCLYQP
jgi:mannose-6-phosphate isomerase-like protein (cupin superfamily)